MKAELKTLEDTLGDLQTEALIVTLPDTPLKEKAETFGDTMDNVKAKPSTRWPIPYNLRGPSQLRHYAM